MSKSHTKKYDPEEAEAANKSTMIDVPNLKGDWLNFYLLLLLYVLQGFPIGLTFTLPLILQSRKMVTYEEQALFSIVLWPFTLKVLLAPLVDSLYVQRIGRRKSWLLPLQYSVGIILMYMASNIDIWLPESGKPNLKMIVSVVFAMNVLSTIQDVVVDGWSLTMLKRNNVGHASTCNTSGLPIGMFIGSVCPILLVSEDFTNKYLRVMPTTGGLITLQSFLFLWSIIFLLITTLIGIFKKEKDSRLELDHVKISVFQNYKLLWDIINKPKIKLLAMALLTARFGFSGTDSASNLKLIDAGVSKDDIMITTTGMYAVKFIMPIFVSKYCSGSKPMDIYLTMIPIKLIWSITYMILIYYTPSLINHNGVINVPIYYYFSLASIFTVNEMLSFVMLLSLTAFFCRLSDPRFGGTYMSLFNTFYYVGWLIPNTLVLKIVALLTFCTCSNDIRNSCLTPDSKRLCALNGGSCQVYVDGYYLTVIICMVIGFVWYFFYKNKLKNYQPMSNSEWSINVS
ncbi:acetyl-coenzyme A transporter 1-like [Myzus persicae]|uniref:acetyl-coenzyme A transporter 1-like n=1 Tax=Myzus persicae TaxID=13164 RepID=UPI000B932A53|nr:acetyl-coenzyme A transporter 1-like [Myzus persicae]XP_022174753.1 acetyl-coenzyme A transporter 1-like [Myzus persicae]XP_022174754.1 acetyl-coenzyme A transporter 1-like [Myzus persicae]XP_022174755.1 acetyl-coenzyme A transporter 1-like [Myzus persicae]